MQKALALLLTFCSSVVLAQEYCVDILNNDRTMSYDSYVHDRRKCVCVSNTQTGFIKGIDKEISSCSLPLTVPEATPPLEETEYNATHNG